MSVLKARTRRHALVDGGINHVASAHDVGLDGFERIVFAGRNLFERGRVHHDGYAGKRALQALCIAHVADEIAQAGMIESRRPHVVLFEFVAAEDDELLGMVLAQHHLDKLLAE